MTVANFSRRFKELVRGLNDTELGYILGVSADAARKMRTGDIKSLAKLQAALRLSRELKVSPWYLAGEPEPAIPLSAGPPDAARGREGRRDGSRELDADSNWKPPRAPCSFTHDEVVGLAGSGSVGLKPLWRR